MQKLKNDATNSAKGIIYQFYVALKYCLELNPGEVLYIEKYGDISISNSKQIEVKKYEDPITDLSHNLWKTISNWLQGNFKEESYKHLLLITTQSFGASSRIKEWNKITPDEKLKILKSINNDYQSRTSKDPETEKLISEVLFKSDSSKLLNVLKKFEILDSSLSGENYLDNIINIHSKGIPLDNKVLYINSLLSFIITPKVVENAWSISFDDFDSYAQILKSQYCTHTKIFPIITRQAITKEDISEQLQHLFVKKIEDINYHQVKEDAISDYIKAKHVIYQDLKSYVLQEDAFNSYESNLFARYISEYRTANRNVCNEAERENKSKDFYDKITGEVAQRFHSFSDTPMYFRNGFLHIMANEADKNIKWKLGDDKDD